MRMLTLLSLGILSIATVFSDHGRAEEPADSVSRLVKPLVDGERVVGISVGVIADGKATTMHFGKTSKDGVKADDDTVYEIGSISKVFTSLILAYAAERDVVALDQPAGDLLPDGVTMPRRGDAPITLLQLSTHRSGLPRLPSNLTEVTDSNPYSKYTANRAHQFLNGFELPRKPGEKYEYSNFGASLLGDLLCRKAKKPYETLLRQAITGPLGMKSTAVELNADMKSRLATPHDGSLEPTSTWEFADMPGAGGIRSSISDMLKFASANLSPPEGPLRAAIELAWKQHQPAGGPGEFAMGLGWHIAGDGSTRWHNGGTGGYRSMMFVSRDLGIAVVMLANTASDAVDPTAELLVRRLAGADVKPLTFEKEVNVPNEIMRRYVGKYQLVPGFVFDVNVVDEKLMVGITGQATQQVFPKSKTEWFYKVVKATLTFKDIKNGKAQSLELFQNGARQTAKRIR